MIPRSPTLIRDWHAHVYFDAESQPAARALYETVAQELAGCVQIGRFHERPVGPHPMWSFQLFVEAGDFSHVLGWLTLNRGPLDVFVHPNTGDELRDHRDSAIWLGRSYELKLDGFMP